MKNYFKVLVPLVILITNQATGQTIMKKSLSEYTGTWTVIAKQTVEQMQKRQGIYLLWRIHRIDALKNEIEITQIGHSFDDRSAIDEPKKTTYKINVDAAGFSILLDGHQQNSKYKLSLKPLQVQDVVMLNGILERLDQKADNKIFIFGKLNDDISAYVKPVGEVEVIVQPPPPIK